MVSEVSASNMENTVRKLVSFGTRHTLSDTKSNTEQVPLMMALSFGKKYTKEGVAMVTGISLRFKITTTANTKIEIAVTSLNMVLSVIMPNIYLSVLVPFGTRKCMSW